MFSPRIPYLSLLFIIFVIFLKGIKGFSSFQYKGIKKGKRRNRRNDKTDIWGENNPALPALPVFASVARAERGVPMKVFPAWMYGDPAIAAERLENIELRAEARERIRELAQGQELERMEQSTLEQMALALKRVIFAPPEIRLKRARIQALAREAMKGRK